MHINRLVLPLVCIYSYTPSALCFVDRRGGPLADDDGLDAVLSGGGARGGRGGKQPRKQTNPKPHDRRSLSRWIVFVLPRVGVVVVIGVVVVVVV